MLCNKNSLIESSNFVDGVDFTRNDPCIFVVYPAGAAGDLLISIIDKHYLRTGCEYYGIDDNGRVHMFTSDYELMDKHRRYTFNDQWFYDLADNLGNRNLNYSLLFYIMSIFCRFCALFNYICFIYHLINLSYFSYI